MAIIPLTSLLSALDWMYTHTPTICRLQAADFVRTSVLRLEGIDT
jgi:hypothetical protein